MPTTEQLAILPKPQFFKLDSKGIIRRANNIATFFTQNPDAQEIENFFQQQHREGIPKKPMNNNYWSKLILRLINKNPELDTNKTSELLNENYRETLQISLEEFSRG